MHSRNNLILFISLFLAGLLIVLLLNLAEKINKPEPLPPVVDSFIDEKVASRMSFGETILVTKECSGIPENVFQEFKRLKQQAVTLIKQENYEQATDYFEKAREYCANAPENLIYLNNAKIGNQEAYTIPVIVPSENSPNPNNAVEMLRGFAQAQWKINQQGGIEGIPLKLLVINDDDNPEIAKQIANYLLKQEDILAVIGHWTSDVSLAVAPIYEQEKLVFITPISITNQLANYENYVFQTNIDHYQGAKRLVEYMVEDWQKQKAAIFYAKNVTYSEEMKRAFRRILETQFEGDVVATFDFNDPDFEPKSSWQQAKDRGAEVLVFATNNESVNKALRVMHVNDGRLKLIGDFANLYRSSTLDEGKEDAVDLVMAIAWHVDNHSDSDFVKNAQQLWGTKSVNYVTAMSYNAMQALITALQSNQNPSRITIQQALKAPNFAAQGAGEEVKFTSQGERQGKVQLVEVRAKTDGNGFEFVPISEVKAEEAINGDDSVPID